jgi:peroxiredoxin
VSVSIEESNSAVDNFIARYGLNYPFLMDSNGNVSRNYNIYTTPTTYFVNPDGVIAGIQPGVIDSQWIDAQMEAIKG